MEPAVDTFQTSTAVVQPFATSTTTSTENQATVIAATTVTSPEIRRSIRVQQRPSLSPLADRLLHRTSAGGVGSPPSTRSGRRTNVSHTTPPAGTSANRRTVARATAEVSSDPVSNNHQPQTNDSSPSHTNPITVPMNSPSDEESNRSCPPNRSNSTRSLVLENYLVDKDGYRCKLCNEVCINANVLLLRIFLLILFASATKNYRFALSLIKVYQAARMSDSNLRLHLGTIHGLQHLLFPSQKKLSLMSTTTATGYSMPTDRRKELHTAAMNCIIDDALPFGAFRRPGMSRFLAAVAPGYVGPHRTTVRRYLECSYKQHRATLRNLLPNVGAIALTTDTWKSSTRVNYICLTGHFFTQSFEHLSLVIGFRRVVGRSLATTLQSYIEHETSRLNIANHQLVSITTDGGSDIKKAVSSGQFGTPIACLAHILHLIVTKGLCIWKKPDEKK